MPDLPYFPDPPLHRFLKRLPGGGLIVARLRRLEQSQGYLPADMAPLPAPVLPVPVDETPSALLQGLLSRSQEQSREEAETAFCRTLLQGLVPDQARILAALSDGTGYPVIHVMAGSRFGFGMKPVLEHVSNVGKSAGVQCPELTPAYLRALLVRGLVEIRPQAGSDLLKYELLETEMVVRRTVDQCEQAGQGCRIARQMVYLSALGDWLWTRCRLDEE